MTHEEHQKRHDEIFETLGEAIADFLHHNPDRLMSTSTVSDLYHWAYQQKREPTEDGPFTVHVHFVCGNCGEPVTGKDHVCFALSKGKAIPGALLEGGKPS